VHVGCKKTGCHLGQGGPPETAARGAILKNELRLRLSRSRSGDVEVRNELHGYFRDDIASIIARYPFTVLEDASSEASLELLEVLVTHEPAPDEDPHRAVTRAVCRKLKNRLL
jgi:hypothetical protein